MTALPPDDDAGPVIPVGVHAEPSLVTPARRMPAPREPVDKSLKRISYLIWIFVSPRSPQSIAWGLDSIYVFNVNF